MSFKFRPRLEMMEQRENPTTFPVSPDMPPEPPPPADAPPPPVAPAPMEYPPPPVPTPDW
ncbi:hypothetical protein [Limnoglobus roseus]|uniref:Uncharacterized protein n=1 Tax=Limnoglobus roseus TaxID=2598579 RepID=A0A5C1ABZ9_9BACT|nr:hypothetical protein [Limnoglobus roseus]QEL15717.1 hypothetical protein PX52LOC_02652 [Limnoglobus roseus]